MTLSPGCRVSRCVEVCLETCRVCRETRCRVCDVVSCDVADIRISACRPAARQRVGLSLPHNPRCPVSRPGKGVDRANNVFPLNYY